MSSSPSPSATPSPVGGSSSARRRHALREFYKLQAAAPPVPEEPKNNDSTEELISRHEHVEKDLDRPGITVDEYITSLVKESNLKAIVKTENELVNEIRSLDSEQKALVYNNYNKLITAASTLESMHGNPDLGKVDQLKLSLARVLSLVKDLPEAPQVDEAPMDQIHAVRWILLTEKALEFATSSGKKEEAKLRATRAIELIDQLEKLNHSNDKLAAIRRKCESIIVPESHPLANQT
jgi:hypothetical protein